ncbi:hypothetical protein Pint_10981 [Pistacia integerrima]|uniref:Uncharacterized protein n=1 Tax=Pistacia integerrima TaxID=434235 RepID=A0ACC0XHE9_9ROSI|nr:hypothetical protein Pint_10981 [Pistacia integerrima]
MLKVLDHVLKTEILTHTYFSLRRMYKGYNRSCMKRWNSILFWKMLLRKML